MVSARQKLIDHYICKIRMLEKDKKNVDYILTSELIDKEIAKLHIRINELKNEKVY